MAYATALHVYEATPAYYQARCPVCRWRGVERPDTRAGRDAAEADARGCVHRRARPGLR